MAQDPIDWRISGDASILLSWSFVVSRYCGLHAPGNLHDGRRSRSELRFCQKTPIGLHLYVSEDLPS